MSLKAIITTLILGSSSLALAAPVSSAEIRDHRVQMADNRAEYNRAEYNRADPVRADQGRADPRRDDDIRDHREQFRRAPRPMPVTLVPVTLASSTRIQGRDVIRVNESLRAFTKLELRSISGRTKLAKVVIVFGNGQSQVVDCNTQLSGQASFSIDLTGNARNIKRIVLVGNSGRRASVDVIAV